MSVVAVIPARMGSTRLPAKVLTDIDGVPLVAHVVDRVRLSGCIDEVLVATDSPVVADVARAMGIDTFISQRIHPTGTDRVAEAVEHLQADIVLNVQADNAHLHPGTVDAVVACFEDPNVQMATPVCPFPEHLDVNDPSHVKVAIDGSNRARYFSRSPVPHAGPWWLHIGVYGFRTAALQRFARWERGVLEVAEDLEQLRFLENEMSFVVTPVDHAGISVDTHADLERLSMFSNSSNEQPLTRF